MMKLASIYSLFLFFINLSAFGEHSSFASLSVDEVDTLDLVYRVIFYLLFLALCFVLVRFVSRKKGFSLSRENSSSSLEVRESKIIGSKQYIAIVECSEKKVLLGVTPSNITYLCEIENVRNQSDETE